MLLLIFSVCGIFVVPSHLERGLLGLGVIGYQYILLITEMKA